ncbi:multicopper oxidase domain-containing protein [Caulobacter sp. 17J65-9]|uniref:multicopper oxidase domain-containing protein n=1 Tax=Caulobacter sp. 17J65-9 TaxID=2709382 RepID=UPI0013CAC377|nr:multicopper oxidase domain-containing protein [Caulobacter sp. 17J65-9]NEX95105.1 multicopper oxidase domain-containing protein [Caulobacter sp. 17J65-9]
MLRNVFAQSGGSGSNSGSGTIDFTKTGVQGQLTFETFGCDVFHVNPATPDRLTPDVTLFRELVRDLDLVAPDGRKIRMWTFGDPKDPKASNGTYPGPLIRVRETQVVHTVMSASKNTHTIHHHGIEPTTFNDGVGHLSFEVTGNYTYQWRPAEAGSFFYHCHKNTTLHFQMGLHGPLIVDPIDGPGRLFTGGPAYDVEAVWAADSLDPRWHLMNHDAGLCGDDVGLNRFEPKYFLISGVFSNRTKDDPRVMVKARPRQRILIRVGCAHYGPIRVTIGADATVVGNDGRGLGDPERPWGRPFLQPAGQPFELTTARRWDLIVTPQSPTTIPAKIEYLDWVTRAVRGVAETRIVVA